MGGWKMIYALINFAVIATALFFVGRKVVLKGYKAYREKIRASLDGGVNAVKEAKEIKESLPALSETGKAESEAILRRADDRAEEMRRQARAEKEAAQAADASKIAAEREKAIEEIRAGMNGYAADVICDKTAQLLQSGDFVEKKQQYTEKICRELAEKLQPTAGERSAVRAGASLNAVVEYAAEPDAALCARIESILRDQYGGDGLTIRSCVNSTLLCGVKVTVGDSVYDGSIKSAVDRARKHIASYEGGVEDAIACADAGMDVYQVGCVEKLSDGICQVTGLSDAMSGELLEFESGQQGMVMDLEKDHVGVAVFDHYDSIHQGAAVRRTGRVIQVPVGEALIGRVVDALGRPLDGKGEIIASAYRPVESPAPGVIARKSVNQPLETGIKAIDMLVPIGRGQRELIIGDRQTGKTSIALDTIINQRGKDVICIYVAIGQKESTVADIVDRLEQYDAMSYTTVVCANASESAPMLYIAPYAGAAMGEYFMYRGRDVLIVYDDLSKHAVAYREISLLLHRPPGREAYPGDVFYLHSRLLERAAKLNDEYGGGSMTALPIIETQAGDISAYIPTNVISITDGQIFLETELFNAGVRPAINAGLSVSRVGGAAQPAALKRFAGRLRVDLAQYRELAAFSQFGSDLDKDTKAALARGERMTQLLKQPRFEPRSATEQVIAAFAMNEGAADSVPVEEIHRFEKDLLAWVQDSLPELDAAVRSGQKLDEELTEKLRGAVRAFPRQ